MARSRSWRTLVVDAFSVRRRRQNRPSRFERRLSFEALEGRRLLAVFVVSNLSDAPVSGPNTAPGTLRQAIFDANSQPDADTIQFASNLSGPVNLSLIGDTADGATALLITSPLTIRGNDVGVAVQRSVFASQMRLFRVAAGGNLTIEQLTLAGGSARGADGLPIGGNGRGGAILNQGTLSISASTLNNNQAGGGNAATGGTGGNGLGGAIFNDGGSVVVKNVTISGNSVLAGTGATTGLRFGGGIYSKNGSLSIFNSTITNNSAGTGRGVYLVGDGGAATGEVRSSIIGSADLPAAFDFLAGLDAGGTIQVTGSNNIIRRQNDFESITISTDDPQLAALAPNGGPTSTHALQASSPAVNQGLNPLNLTTDQRGGAFARVSNGFADIGAFERQVTGAPALPGDYNGNSVVDTADYVVWRNTLDSFVTFYLGADGNGDGQINTPDYDIWRANFGRVPSASASAVDNTEPAISADLRIEPSAEIMVEPAAGSAVATPRDAVFVGLSLTERRRPGEATVKSAFFRPNLGRNPLELLLIDSCDTMGRQSSPAVVDGPLWPLVPENAADEFAVDELLAEWPAAIRRDRSF